jgi:hypothetical protein
LESLLKRRPAATRERQNKMQSLKGEAASAGQIQDGNGVAEET